MIIFIYSVILKENYSRKYLGVAPEMLDILG